MENDAEIVLEKLSLQLGKMREMLQVTQELSLSPSVDSADSYVEMVEKRELLLTEIKEIEDLLKSPDITRKQPAIDDAFGMEAESIKAEIKNIARQITQLDEKHNAVCQLIIGDLKKNIKDISNQKNVNTYYQYDAPPVEGSYFDKKK